MKKWLQHLSVSTSAIYQIPSDAFSLVFFIGRLKTKQESSYFRQNNEKVLLKKCSCKWKFQTKMSSVQIVPASPWLSPGDFDFSYCVIRNPGMDCKFLSWDDVPRDTVWARPRGSDSASVLIMLVSSFWNPVFIFIESQKMQKEVLTLIACWWKRKLERIQKRALRAVFKSKTESYGDLLKRTCLPTLYQGRLQKIATLMFKVKNGQVPHYISELFHTIPKGYNLRNADFNIPRFRATHYGKHSLRFFGPPMGKVKPCRLWEIEAE